jgi:hypothetical protein
MNVLRLFYKKLVPSRIRNVFLKRQIIAHYNSHEHLQSNAEWTEVVNRLKCKVLEIFPYDYTDQYKEEDIVVHYDALSGLSFVIQDEKKLYFKRGWDQRKIRRNYNRLRIEQDPASPHFYTSIDFQVGERDVVADIGCAEGNFSLAIVEKVKQLYLFECDPGWLEALQHTFEPWKDKVLIIPKFVSDKTDSRNIRGDDFFANKEIDFFKIDVDGGERSLLDGLTKTITGKKRLKLAFCTYHRQQDEQDFSAYFRSHGFSVSPGKRFMIFFHDMMICAPYLRRGLIRAKR